MKHLIPFFLIALICFSCTETEEPTQQGPDPKEEPEIKPLTVELEQLHSPVASGQRIDIKTTLSEELSGSIYKWEAVLDGDIVAELETEHTSIAMHLEYGPGDYTFNLEVINGERKATASHVIEVMEPHFEYGLWTNSKDVILASEEINGNDPHQSMIGMPNPLGQQSADEDRIVYSRPGARYIAYYFVDDRLKGGSIVRTGSSTNEGGVYDWYRGYYGQIKYELDQRMGEGTEVQDWKVSDSVRESYENQPNGEGYGMAVDHGNLTITTTWESDTERAEFFLRRGNQSGSFMSVQISSK